MSADLRERLQSTLGNTYILERELGGGGMSRVFLADETAFGRKVVVKVLPPDLAAGVSVERFKREIQVSARLQHPHIVPVLSAGESDGLPFYTMPFVEGESLRRRLVRGGLSLEDVVGVLREVARALAYAHERGVVHRDIKPDNVMLSGGSAVVTDFGIAKAIAAARSGEHRPHDDPMLTQSGVSLGTPAYMAPEQAAGDPAIDHRADIYAFGAMAYELLTGRTPFHGLPPHKMLLAHMNVAPASVSSLRPDTPPPLADLVMRCLDKDPDARPQTAADLARVLGTVTSASGEPATPAATPAATLAGRPMVAKALGLYAAAFVVVAALARAAIVAIGLPDWVFPGALIVMALGLPAVLFTAFVNRHSWRRTAIAVVITIGSFVALVGGWMLLRALGIGPAGSLMAAGRMGERERVVLAGFSGTTSDSLLPPTITEAFRTDLAESANLSVMPELAVRDALRRMQHPANTSVDLALAREIATREGIKAVIDGKVTELGGSYVLSARLVSAQTGEEMATVGETADDEREIIPAIGRLSRKLRSRVGESLRAIQQAPALDQVTTASLPALQKYVASNRAIQGEGDLAKGIRLLEEAIALDSTFAMAYRRLAAELTNGRLDPVRVQALLQKAYDHRDRLSDAERYLTLGSYYHFGPNPDLARATSAMESLVELQPRNAPALNNLALYYRFGHEHAKGETAARRALASEQNLAVIYNNLFSSQLAQGKVVAAESTTMVMTANLPQNPATALRWAELAVTRGQRDGALAILDSLRRARPGDLAVQDRASNFMAALAATGGRIHDYLRWSREGLEAAQQQGNRNGPLLAALIEAEAEVWFRGRPARALALLDQTLAEHPLDSLAPLERPYEFLVRVYSLAGRPDRARAYLAAFDERRKQVMQFDDEMLRDAMVGAIAMAERRYEEAVRAYGSGDIILCAPCALPYLARAYDLAGSADSAIAAFERYTTEPSDPVRITEVDGLQLASAHKRLGELYEAKGDAEKAASHYAKFVDLWKSADPEMQPLVRQARERLAVLQRAERR